MGSLRGFFDWLYGKPENTYDFDPEEHANPISLTVTYDDEATAEAEPGSAGVES